MRVFFALLLLNFATGCTPTPLEPETENEHYLEWQDGGGWRPDYHDQERTR